MQSAQSIQEQQYSFPYHHVSKFRSGFSAAFFVRYGLKHVASLEWILDQVKKLDFQTACDIGCGDGRFVAELMLDFPEKKISGIDYSERSIFLAKGMTPSADFRNINILEKEVEEQFDLLTLIEVFEHIPISECSAFAKAVSKLSPKGGYLMMTVPHKNLKLSDKHFQHFSLNELKEYFEPYYEVEKVQFLEKKSRTRLYFYYRLLKNKLFILNNKKLLNWIFQGYKRHVLLADNEETCERLFLLFRRK